MGAMNTGDFSIQSLKNRQSYIDGLWNDINRRICDLSEFYSELDYTQKHSYEILIKLFEKSEYTISEWEVFNTEGTSFDVEVKNEAHLTSVYALIKLKDEIQII